MLSDVVGGLAGWRDAALALQLHETPDVDLAPDAAGLALA